jgi:pimeloyl-ACP methyl ester carboxylesterase
MAHLTGDLAGLLDALGLKDAIFCGHDWGGLVVWQMPVYQPQRVRGVIGINTPFLKRPPVDPITALRAFRGDDNYVVVFQQPGVADAILAKDVGKTFRFFMRRSMVTAEVFAKLPKEAKSLALVKAIDSDEAGWTGSPLLTSEEMKHFVDAYERTGFTGGINWYRNLTRNWIESGTMEQMVRVPGLMIMAEDDVVLPPSMADGMERFVPDLEKKLIRNCGHWTQQEHPDETNAIIIDWLKRRFK